MKNLLAKYLSFMLLTSVAHNPLMAMEKAADDATHGVTRTGPVPTAAPEPAPNAVASSSPAAGLVAATSRPDSKFGYKRPLIVTPSKIPDSKIAVKVLLPEQTWIAPCHSDWTSEEAERYHGFGLGAARMWFYNSLQQIEAFPFWGWNPVIHQEAQTVVFNLADRICREDIRCLDGDNKFSLEACQGIHRLSFPEGPDVRPYLVYWIAHVRAQIAYGKKPGTESKAGDAGAAAGPGPGPAGPAKPAAKA
jgi:hypothetical protein